MEMVNSHDAGALGKPIRANAVKKNMDIKCPTLSECWSIRFFESTQASDSVDVKTATVMASKVRRATHKSTTLCCIAIFGPRALPGSFSRHNHGERFNRDQKVNP